MSSNPTAQDRPPTVPQPRSQPLMTPEQKVWLLFVLLVLFTLPLMGGTYWMDLQSRKEIERVELQRNLIQARTLSVLVQREFTAAQSLLVSVADRSSVQRAWATRDSVSLRSHLKQARELDPAFLFLSVYELDGTMRAIDPEDQIVGWNFAYRDWYRGVSAEWQPYVSEVYATAAGSHPLVVAVAVPIRDEAGEPTGILMATYSLDELTRKFDALEKGSMSEFYVVDQRGVVAASPKIDPQAEPARLPASPGLIQALSVSEGSGRLLLDGHDVFVGYAPVQHLGWSVIYSRSAAQVLAPTMRLHDRNRSIAFFVLLVYLITAAFAAHLVRHQGQMLAANQALNRDLENHILETRKAREELDRYFTVAVDLMCIAGADGYFKRVNPAWQKTLGFTPEELLSKPHMEFVHPDDRERTIRAAEEQKQGAEIIGFENRYLCKDGSYRWVSWSATSFMDESLVYAVGRDVTELKKVQDALKLAKEEAERSNRFKDQFLSTMSHELRTPLNAVVGFSDLLTEESYGPLNDRQKRYLGHIRNGGKHLLRLINDILDLSRIEAGRLQLTIENVPVKILLAEVLDIMRPLADKKSQILAQHAVPDLCVRADSTRFKQVLLNLIGNAIKFTPERGKVELEAKVLGEMVRIAVRDSGPGIPPEEKERIFEAFYRVVKDEKSTEGTGLGLAITRRLIELQGGHLGVDSEPGSGSCFYFTLPICAFSQPVADAVVNLKLNKARSSCILVVEDDAKAAHLLQSHLHSAGYDVVRCDKPEKAVETAAELQPCAITIDIIMKPINGWELLPLLKSDPRTAAIPVIVVSVVDQPATGALLGADEYVVKPVSRLVLLAAIERCLNRKGRIAKVGPILVVEDDTTTREFITELLSKHGYKVCPAIDGADAREQVTASLPELVILDLILPQVSGFQLLAEWRSNPRTAELPVFVLTSKDLTREEMSYLRSNVGALFRKQELWQEALMRQLQRVVLQVLAEKV